MMSGPFCAAAARLDVGAVVATEVLSGSVKNDVQINPMMISRHRPTPIPACFAALRDPFRLAPLRATTPAHNPASSSRTLMIETTLDPVPRGIFQVKTARTSAAAGASQDARAACSIADGRARSRGGDGCTG